MKLKYILSALCLLIGFNSFADNTIYIKLGDGQTKKSLLALPPLNYLGASNKNPEVGVEVFNVISNDLSVSSYFDFVSQKAFLENTATASLRPTTIDPKGFKFESWSTIGAEFLIKIGYTVVDKQLEIETYLYQVSQAKLIVAKKYKGPASAARRIAHSFANDVLEALTGKTGMFLSKFVATSDRAGGNFREVYVMDWDGTQVEKISNHKTISLSPAWSFDGKKIAYTAYVIRTKTKMRNADMFIYELDSGKRFLTSYRQGMNSGASFAPDNKHIYLTLSQGQSPDIYKMAYDGTIVSRVTTGPNGAMNVEPTVSADGSKIAFSSDRPGRPMIYTMNVDGSNVKRITYAGVFNSTPSWSPDGKKIAFAGQSDDHFDIFVMDADGTNMVRLTSAKKPNGRWSSNEDPSFSPDGRFVVYTSNRTGKNQIYISTIDGNEERRITMDNNNYYKPKWSKNFE